MKKSIWKLFIMAFLLVTLLPLNAFAENGNEVRLDETGRVTIVSPSASAEGASSLQFSLTVDAENASRVEFAFDAVHAKISEFRYHQETKRLNVYMAGTEALFDQENSTLTMGRVVALDGNGNDVGATVTVIPDSVQYVSGSELKAMEGVSVSDPVRLPGKEPGNDGDNGSGDGGDNGSGDDGNGGSEGDNSGNDDSQDDDSDDDESQDNGSQGAAGNGQGGNQGAGSSRPSGGAQGSGSAGGTQGSRPAGGTQGSKPADAAQGTGGSTQPVSSSEPVAGSSAENTSAPTAEPSPAPEATPSAESSSAQATKEPAATPESQPAVGNGQDGTENGQGINWILILVIIAVVLLAGVGIMAVVVLNGKPKKKDFGDEE